MPNHWPSVFLLFLHFPCFLLFCSLRQNHFLFDFRLYFLFVFTKSKYKNKANRVLSMLSYVYSYYNFLSFLPFSPFFCQLFTNLVYPSLPCKRKTCFVMFKLFRMLIKIRIVFSYFHLLDSFFNDFFKVLCQILKNKVFFSLKSIQFSDSIFKFFILLNVR